MGYGYFLEFTHSRSVIGVYKGRKIKILYYTHCSSDICNYKVATAAEKKKERKKKRKKELVSILIHKILRCTESSFIKALGGREKLLDFK